MTAQKLSDGDVIHIREALAAGARPSELARTFSVTCQTIYRIKRGLRATSQRGRKTRTTYRAPILERYTVDLAGCWLYQGYVNHDGYGMTTTAPAHRVFYESHVGPIPDGFQVDHLCGVKSCVNPAHLEAVTQYENLRRAGFGGHRPLPDLVPPS